MGLTGSIAVSAAGGVLLGATMCRVAQRFAQTDRGRRLLQPAILAALTAAVFAGLAARGEPDVLVFLADAALVTACIPLAVIDLAEQRLPTWLVLPLYPALLILITVHSLVQGEPAHLLRAGAGMGALFVFYLAIAVLTGQLGAGDVRLSGVLGLVLAWHSWTALVLGTLLGLLAAAAAGLVAIVVLRRPRSHRLPLGTSLTAGALAALLTQPAAMF